MNKQIIYILKYEECYNDLYYSGIISPYSNIEDAKVALHKMMYQFINESSLGLEDAEISDNKVMFDLDDGYVIYEIVERILI